MAPPRKKRYAKCDEVTPEMIAFARKRTDFLTVDHILSIQPLKDTLANAYLQGIRDAAHTIDVPQKPTQQPAPAGLS